MGTLSLRSFIFIIYCIGMVVLFATGMWTSDPDSGLTQIWQEITRLTKLQSGGGSTSSLLEVVEEQVYVESSLPRPHRFLQTSSSSSNQTNQTSSGAVSTSSSHAKHKSPAFDPMVFFLVTYVGSIFCQQLVHVLPHCVRPPHSVLLYSFGMWITMVAAHYPDTEFGVAITSFTTIDSHVIFWIFLPVLLYEDAAASDWHVVSRVLPSAMLLALPGVVFNACLTAGLIRLLDVVELKPALLLGSILSATDPVAVVGALAALQAPMKLSSIISGESLLNDGSAVVLFQIFLDVAAGRKEFKFGEALEKLIRLAGGGVLFGLCVAAVCKIWLVKTKTFTVQIMLIVLCIFISFFVPEHSEVGMSGVLGVVTFGFFMAATGKYDLAVESEHEHHAIVSFLAFVSNEAIFIIAGCVGYSFSFKSTHINEQDWYQLAILYVGVHVTRALTVLVCYPILHNIGYRLGAKEAVICVVGGLRGAVGLALGLQVLDDTDIPQRVRDKICFHTNGIVLGTLFLNGIFVTPIYKALNIESPSRAQHHSDLLHLLLQHADHLVHKRAKILSSHWFFQDCHMEIVEKLVPTLSDGLKNASHDFYGRRRHARNVNDIVGLEMENLIEHMLDDDIVGSFKAKLSTIDFCENPNIFHAHTLEKNHKDAKLHQAVSIAKKTGVNLRISAGDLEIGHQISNAASMASLNASGLLYGGSGALNHTTSTFDYPAVPSATVCELDDVIAAGRVRTNGHKPMVSPSHTIVDSTMTMTRQESNSTENRRSTPMRYDDDETTGTHGMSHFTFFSLRNSGVLDPQKAQDSSDGLCMELNQTLVNSKKAAYTQMYETKALNKHAFDFLLASVDFQIEAIQGDLKDYHFLKKRFQTLHKQNQNNQMLASPRVAFEYIKAHLHQTREPLSNFLYKHLLHKSSYYDWLMLRRNVRILIAYCTVLKQNMHELHHVKNNIFKMDPSAQMVIKGMLDVMKDLEKQAREVVMLSEVEKRPVMFRAYEHILFADLVVVQQNQVLRELIEEGNLGETDVEHFVKNITDPTCLALDQWRPTLPQLHRVGGGKVKHYIGTLDSIISCCRSLVSKSA